MEPTLIRLEYINFILIILSIFSTVIIISAIQHLTKRKNQLARNISDLEDLVYSNKDEAISEHDLDLAIDTMQFQLRTEIHQDLKDNLKKENQIAVQNHKRIIEYLWSILDDIDTLSDTAEHDVVYRQMVEKAHQKRWLTGIKLKGENLDFSKMKIPDNN